MMAMQFILFALNQNSAFSIFLPAQLRGFSGDFAVGCRGKNSWLQLWKQTDLTGHEQKWPGGAVLHHVNFT